MSIRLYEGMIAKAATQMSVVIISLSNASVIDKEYRLAWTRGHFGSGFAL